MSQTEKMAILYDQIIARVIEDSRERFASEGADSSALNELQRLWWEKLQQSGMLGSSRASMGVGGAAGYDHMAVKHEDHGLQFPSGAPPARMAPSHAMPDTYGKMAVKSELPQTDGADVGDMEAGAATARPGRRAPRRGDYVEVELSMGDEGSRCGGAGGLCLRRVEQLDGAGSAPAKRRREDDEGEDEDFGADDDDDDPLNSDDDDDEEDSEDHDTDNLVLCQYDKVTRTKNKWKALLKFGVMTLNTPDGRKQDFIFNKGTADMNFAN